MDIKSILAEALGKKKDFERAREIENLDLTPEEYHMLREDKDKVGIDLLYAILEKVKLSEWQVDEAMRRIARVSQEDRGSFDGKRSFSCAITSNTRRFFYKGFRDYPELESLDLVEFNRITDAIAFIEREISRLIARRLEEERVKQEELQRKVREQRELEEKRLKERQKKMRELLDELSTLCNRVEERRIEARQNTEMQIEIVQSQVSRYCAKFSDEIVEAVGVAVVNQGSGYKIIDDVPCRFQVDASSKMRTYVSESFIRDGLSFANLAKAEKCDAVGFDEGKVVCGFFGFPDMDRLVHLLRGVTSVQKGENAVLVQSNGVDSLAWLESIIGVLRENFESIAEFPRIFSCNNMVFVDEVNQEAAKKIFSYVDRVADNAKVIIWSRKEGVS